MSEFLSSVRLIVDLFKTNYTSFFSIPKVPKKQPTRNCYRRLGDERRGQLPLDIHRASVDGRSSVATETSELHAQEQLVDRSLWDERNAALVAQGKWTA